MGCCHRRMKIAGMCMQAAARASGGRLRMHWARAGAAVAVVDINGETAEGVARELSAKGRPRHLAHSRHH